MFFRFLQPATGRIFVSYRRQDAQWFAGRLADALTAYFGDRRVFRDIESIAGGADFAQVIDASLTASDAVIAVIGRDWLDARDERGNRRLDQPGDWVAQELSAALAKGLPVYPVLVEDARMPRADELPAALQPLVRFNAVSVSDNRWDADTARLARIISLDIPSATGRRLQRLSAVIATALAAALVFELSVFVRNLLEGLPSEDAVAGKRAELSQLGRYLWQWSEERCANLAADYPQLQQLLTLVPNKAQGAAAFVVMTLGSAWMLVHRRDVDPSARAAFDAAVGVGALGSLAVFALYYPVCDQFEALTIFFSGMVLGIAMLACLSLSGFKAR